MLHLNESSAVFDSILCVQISNYLGDTWQTSIFAEWSGWQFQLSLLILIRKTFCETFFSNPTSHYFSSNSILLRFQSLINWTEQSKMNPESCNRVCLKKQENKMAHCVCERESVCVCILRATVFSFHCSVVAGHFKKSKENEDKGIFVNNKQLIPMGSNSQKRLRHECKIEVYQ